MKLLCPTAWCRILGITLSMQQALWGCAAQRAGYSAAAPKPAHPGDIAALRARIIAAQTPYAHLHADVRLISFGPDGRLRGRAEVYVSRPDKLRYTLFGPQGGPLLVLACDGDTLRGLDMHQRRFVVGEADAEQFDAWLSPVHLRLDARGWVRLLFGEVDVPADAQQAPDAPAGTWALMWHQHDNMRFWAAFNRTDARLREARLYHGDVVEATVAIDSRDSRGVPEALHITHKRPSADGVTQVELQLRDIDVATLHHADTYSLLPPPGFAIVAPQMP